MERPSDLACETLEERKARLRSVNGGKEGRFLSSIPSYPRLCASDRDFRTAVELRLGLHLWGGQLDASGDSCDGSGNNHPHRWIAAVSAPGNGRIKRHDSMVNLLAHHMNAARMEPTVEVTCRNTRGHHRANGEDERTVRADIRAWVDDEEQLYDVAIVHPVAPTYVRQAAKAPRSASRSIEQSKLRHYKSVVARRRCRCRCVPLVFETYGKWGAQAVKVVEKIVERRAGSKGSAHDRLWARISSEISMCLQRGNARTVADRTPWRGRPCPS